METLPFPQYGEGELIYRAGQGFIDMTLNDFLANDGLGYTTLWSIGCPFHCTYCGNTKFIANDPTYKRLRHPSARYIVDEVKTARARFPHISQVSFHDDSFMAIPYEQLEEFSELWREELELPFAVYGVIPNYVRQDKFEILTWAGMNRIRMGIQSGSQRILDFYKRPSPPRRILEAGEIAATSRRSTTSRRPTTSSWTTRSRRGGRRRHARAALRDEASVHAAHLLAEGHPEHRPRDALEGSGGRPRRDGPQVPDHPAQGRQPDALPLALWRPPRWILDRCSSASSQPEPQKLYPIIGIILRTLYLTKRVLSHLRVMDFSITRAGPATSCGG